MKRISVLLFLALFCSVLLAQQKLSFSVLEFEQDVFDISAKSAEHGKKDGNGSWYAIIKVTSNNADDDITACQFNFGNMASKVEKHDEALWVYVQRNAKRVTISRPGYHTISQYDLQTTIEAGANYKMVLTSDRVQQQVVYDVKMQMVKFQTSPAVQGAIVTVTNQTTGQKESVGVTGSNGAVSKALNFGRYSYEVLAPDNLYYPSEGIITLNSSDNVFTEKVLLRPQFAEISLSVANDADIYINNEMKGKGRWNGKLSSGTYIVICKKENHKDSQHKLVVEEGEAQVLSLPRPTPITGTLVINTTPTDANINIDGMDYGKTPKLIKNLLIGHHETTISLSGYKSEKKTTTIKEEDITTIDIQLQKDFPNKNNNTENSVPIINDDNLTFTVNGVVFKMMYVENGNFNMGDQWNRPIHKVTITNDYYIGETEVTGALWKAVMSNGNLLAEHLNDDIPVSAISWNACQDFISRLTDLTGRKFRLPSEAEWEYAARGGRKSKGYKYYVGGDQEEDVAWVNSNSGGQKHPVKTKSPNELGIYDMSGNVMEWCNDWYDSYSSDSQIDPVGPPTGTERARRGSCYSGYVSSSPTSRGGISPEKRLDYLGFRLCLEK